MSRLARNLLILLIAGPLLVSVSEAAVRGAGAGSFSTADTAAAQARPRSEGMSLTEAVARAQRRFPGRVVKAETKGRSGRREHVVRIINDQGRVRTFRIDAQSGAFL